MRTFCNVLLSISSIYGILVLLVFLFQSSCVHLPNIPGRQLVATPKQAGLDYETVSLVTADGVKLHGWFVPAQQARRTVLFFHGNAGNISHRLENLAIFHQLGLNTLIIDYRGYGLSEGRPSETGLYRDAEAALQYLQETRGISAADIIVFGHSLGGAVAAWLAARHPLGALIIESSFTSIPAIAADLYPWLPARWLTRLHYDTLGNLQAVSSPVLIIHSPEDEIIPFHHGRRLFEVANPPKQFLEIRGDHNSGFLQSRLRYKNGIANFLNLLEELTPANP